MTFVYTVHDFTLNNSHLLCFKAPVLYNLGRVEMYYYPVCVSFPVRTVQPEILEGTV